MPSAEARIRGAKSSGFDLDNVLFNSILISLPKPTVLHINHCTANRLICTGASKRAWHNLHYGQLHTTIVRQAATLEDMAFMELRMQCVCTHTLLVLKMMCSVVVVICGLAPNVSACVARARIWN